MWLHRVAKCAAPWRPHSTPPAHGKRAKQPTLLQEQPVPEHTEQPLPAHALTGQQNEGGQRSQAGGHASKGRQQQGAAPGAVHQHRSHDCEGCTRGWAVATNWKVRRLQLKLWKADSA